MPHPTEASPLLSPSTLEAGVPHTAPSPAPSWHFWNRPPFRHVRFAESDQSLSPSAAMHGADDEPDQPDRPKQPFYRSEEAMGRWLVYCLLVLVGMILGASFSRHWTRGEGKLGDGPMVPPVWTLPPPTGLPRNDPYLINATSAAVASEDVTCSNLGLDILRNKNGSAVDSAISTTLCIGLLNAFSSGIGGGGFMVVRVPEEHYVPHELLKEIGYEGQLQEGRVVAFDFRETSPEKSEVDMYGTSRAGRAAAQVGGLAVAVPGELRGLEAAHKLYGTLPWEDVVMPVADLAKGWKVSRELAKRLRFFGQFMLSSPAWKAIYAPRGELLVEGEFIQRTNYGKTLEKIAREGAEAFYHGEIAESTVETIKNAGGIMTLNDASYKLSKLKHYKALAYPAIHGTFMSKEVYTTSAPSSGGVLLGLLSVLEPLNITSTGGLRDVLNAHRFIEALKFAFGARSAITDPAFAANRSALEDVHSKQWADDVRAKITDDATHSADYYGLQYDTPIDHGTTHISVADQWGGAASVTSTINLIWGSHVMDSKTGIIFNDEQDDFAVPGAADAFGLWPSPWNYPMPGKKPLSSTAASIILSPPTRSHPSTLYAVLGGSGGSRIFPSIAQVVLNLFSGKDISKSIEEYRLHNQIVPDLTTMEVGPEGENRELVEGLKAKGHKIGEFDVNIGISEVQAIVLQDGRLFASSDSRKNGIAAGH
ncbi:gamma-glutamyltransferase [Cryptococcus floricola]|uniref:Glutathione hydrolase n=1 Tax=Cryptococcus floricola TaxID=2591691 RepID=A0A5D3ARJ8_9TREE|nr:gamma-glutamyltransferase [Cryptococcus floricola]